jgi:hypothetical protein
MRGRLPSLKPTRAWLSANVIDALVATVVTAVVAGPLLVRSSEELDFVWR